MVRVLPLVVSAFSGIGLTTGFLSCDVTYNTTGNRPFLLARALARNLALSWQESANAILLFTLAYLFTESID